MPDTRVFDLADGRELAFIEYGAPDGAPLPAFHGSPGSQFDFASRSRLRRAVFAVLWGLAFGVLQASSPLALRWLDPSTVHALSISFIAAVYIGFAVADGRPRVIAVEVAVAGMFVVLAATGVTATAWLLVIGYAAHGCKDAWQERTHFVSNTRWWPPFCATIAWLVAAILIIEIAVGVNFHS